MIIDPLFASRRLNTDGVAYAHKVEELFSDLLHTLQYVLPEGREFSIVKTKLEEASFYAKKALSKQDKYTEV